MAKVRIKANYNIAALSLNKGRELVLEASEAKKYTDIKLMYMSEPMATIIEEAKVEKEEKKVFVKKVKKEAKD